MIDILVRFFKQQRLKALYIKKAGLESENAEYLRDNKVSYLNHQWLGETNKEIEILEKELEEG